MSDRYDAFKGRSDLDFSRIDAALLHMGVEPQEVWSVVAGMFG